MKNMKLVTLLFTGFFMLGISQISTAQTQLNNSGFEDWENVGSATEEPLEWNSFKTASGTLAYLYGSKTIAQSTVKRPGSTGTYSCLIWSKTVVGIVANGNVTTGQINMGSSTATDPSNYNVTHTADAAFSEALGGSHPDSLVFWAKYVPSNTSGTDSARMRGVIHSTFDLHDPLDLASQPYVVGDATLNFPSTLNQWKRISVPFTYTGPATTADYMLLTFTTNKTPGGGSGGDSLYIDDLSLIYNGVGISDIENTEKLFAFTDANNININLSLEKSSKSEIAVYNVYGQIVYQTQVVAQNIQHQIGVDQFGKGIYIVTVTTEENQRFSQKISVK